MQIITISRFLYAVSWLSGSASAATITLPPTVPGIARVSVTSSGAQANSDSYGPIFRPAGNGIAFYTDATNLFANDLNTATDTVYKVFATGVVKQVTTEVPAGPGTPSYGVVALLSNPDFSSDGKTAVFYGEDANGLVAGDTNGVIDVFMKRFSSGIITKISAGAGGVPADGLSCFPAISPNGTKIAYQSYATNIDTNAAAGKANIFVYDVTTGVTKLVSANLALGRPNGGAALPRFSPDSTRLVFDSLSSNLVANDTNAVSDVFVYRISSGAIIRVSTTPTGIGGNNQSTHGNFSPDGRKVVFQSAATNLVPSDTNGSLDLFVKNLTTGDIQLVSTDINGVQGNADSSHPVFSPDGQKIAFQGASTNFAPNTPAGQSEIYVKNLVTGALTLVSVNTAGLPSVGNSNHPQWSPDGTLVTFASSASDLVPGDTNRKSDVFVAKLPAGF